MRGAGLRVVHAFFWPAPHVPLGPSPLGPPDGGTRNMADRLVAEAVEHARAAAPDGRTRLGRPTDATDGH
ncbi:hypothetical protein ALMP_40100 [Streptomyces sp. A012304]|nr:hypothetical protein ALMP_40100 [Streptomyces sp. A012304]